MRLNPLRELKHRPKEWNESSLCGLVVGKGIGRAFCAGGDVAGMCRPYLEFPPRANASPDVIANAANENTRHKAIDYFKSE